MSDFDRTRVGDGPEERLPWLEAVEEEERSAGPRAATLVAAVVVALIAIGLVVGGVFLLRDRHGPATASGELIPAPEGSYKVKPDAPGGMKIEGAGDTSFAASAGQDTNAAIDLSAIPETPVAGAGSVTHADAAANAPPPKPVVPAKSAAAPPPEHVATATPPKAKPEPAATKAAPTKETSVASAGGVSGPGTIQLGAFSSQTKAESAWKSLSGRFSMLGGLSKAIVSATVNGSTVYRLRAAAGGQASTICGKLRVAGEDCAVVG